MSLQRKQRMSQCHHQKVLLKIRTGLAAGGYMTKMESSEKDGGLTVDDLKLSEAMDQLTISI